MSLTAIQTQGIGGAASGSIHTTGLYQPYTTYPQGNTIVQTLMSQSILKIAPALLKAKLNFTAATKDAQNPYFKSTYADLNAVLSAVEPSLLAEGILLLQPTVQKDGKNYVRTLLLHSASGEFIASDTEIVVKANGTAQDNGSGMSYSRRYGLQSLLAVRTSDDDAGAASGRTVAPAAETAKPRSSFSKNKSVSPPGQNLPTEAQELAKQNANKEDGWE